MLEGDVVDGLLSPHLGYKYTSDRLARAPLEIVAEDVMQCWRCDGVMV
jgi:hypothetical protein